MMLVTVGTARGEGLPETSQLDIQGDARWEKKHVRLTQSRNDQAGAAWLRAKQPVAAGFDTRFTFRFTHQGGLGNGADGLAFVVQNSAPGAVGAWGGSGGFGFGQGKRGGTQEGIPFSLAVFFDSYRNREYSDPSDNALHVCLNGTSNEKKWPPSRLSVIPHLQVKLKDGKEHEARVQYRPPFLIVYLDDELLVQTPVDLSLVTDAEGKAWVGFTASTGSGYENHDLLAWNWSSSAESSISMVESSISFVLKACLPGRNLCTPEEPLVEEKEPGSYHVVLPAHLEWGASIPNASGRAIQVVNQHGLVCWDVSLGPDGCGGPEVALVSRTASGQTQFSIRDDRRNFDDNQGYLEFDVRLK